MVTIQNPMVTIQNRACQRRAIALKSEILRGSHHKVDDGFLFVQEYESEFRVNWWPNDEFLDSSYLTAGNCVLSVLEMNRYTSCMREVMPDWNQANYVTGHLLDKLDNAAREFNELIESGQV
jgi:hypothetical protein